MSRRRRFYSQEKKGHSVKEDGERSLFTELCMGCFKKEKYQDLFFFLSLPPFVCVPVAMQSFVAGQSVMR